jgi:transposase
MAAGQAVAVAADADALRGLARRVADDGERVRATVEGMTGARFVHDQLDLAGWDVLIADAQRVRGLAPLAAKTDKIDAYVLAELTRRALVPEIWLPTPTSSASERSIETSITRSITSDPPLVRPAGAPVRLPSPSAPSPALRRPAL